MRIAVLFLGIFFFCSCSENRHVDTYIDALDEGWGNSFYVSQSVLRMANVKHDPDFNKFLKPLKGIEVYVNNLDSLGNSQLPDLLSLLDQDGYELLIESRFQDLGRFSVYDNDESYAVIGKMDDKPVLLISRGKPDQNYLSAFTNMDNDGIKDLLKNGGPFGAIDWD